ncbi:MAG: HAMP domain-containing histidine kinase [Magnetococcales bacterium]|nr:HAMP domain-containing histidine kinase [Magnetococcales bacterium]
MPVTKVPLLQGRRPVFAGDVSHICEEGLRATEMSERSWWFIQTRWISVALCSLGSIWATLPSLRHFAGLHIDFRYFLAVTLLLALSNLVYRRWAKTLAVGQPSKGGVCRLLMVQVLTDFMSLSILTYGLGGVETPVLILFLPHIILLTLFFARFYSFVMTWVGIFFATLPMVLEYAGVVPTLSLFDVAQKVERISANLLVTVGYVLAIAAAYLVSWYLVSEITSGLRQRELELEQAYDRLQLLTQEKAHITLRATHELKAPFAAIKSYVYTLRDGYCGTLPEKAQQVVVRIGERCDLLMEKITSIIHLSNLRTLTPATIALTTIDLLPLLTKEVEEARLVGQVRGIKVEFQPGDKASPLLASQEHMHTLLANLLLNAINYSKEGGVVEVALDVQEKQVLLHIQDHGIGIPSDHLARIFDEHFRSNNAVRHNPNSSGMGLALVREIVTLHGGDIQVVSQLGEGSRFSVSLPCLPRRPAADDSLAERGR